MTSSSTYRTRLPKDLEKYFDKPDKDVNQTALQIHRGIGQKKRKEQNDFKGMPRSWNVSNDHSSLARIENYMENFDVIKHHRDAILEDFDSNRESSDKHIQYIAVPESFHPYRGVEQPRRIEVEVPPTLGMETSSILTPAQRRANAEYEKSVNVSKTMLKNFRASEARAKNKLAFQYPNGVTGIDSIENNKSSVYGEKARRFQVERERRENNATYRRELIAAKTVSQVRRGYDFLSYDPVKMDDQGWLYRRGHVDTIPGQETTSYEKLFRRETPAAPTSMPQPPVSPVARRRVDIITGCKSSV